MLGFSQHRAHVTSLAAIVPSRRWEHSDSRWWTRSTTKLVVLLAAGALVGALSALFGVGGGILMVPFTVLALHESQHVAEGTSLLVLVPTALVRVLVHRQGNLVAFGTAALLAAGGVGGAYVGAAWALCLPAETLQVMFGIPMAIVGTRTIVKGVAPMRSENR